MPDSPLTVTLPEPLLKRLRGRARRANRTVEAEVVQLLSEAVVTSKNGSTNGTAGRKIRVGRKRQGGANPPEEELPPDIAEAIAEVPALDDRALRAAMKPLITPRQAKRLAELNYQAQDTGLSAAEAKERDRLLHVYDKSMVVRAAVMAELHKRGVNVAELIGT